MVDALNIAPLAAESGGGNFLVTPGLGLMIWTLIAFGITYYVLKRLAFPRIATALDKRRKAIDESIDSAVRTKKEADELLDEYRARLKEAREQADDIVARSRRAADAMQDESKAEAKRYREELMESTRRDIETETQRSLDQIRKEVADLTVIATEKVTRKSLDDDDHRRLIEEALSRWTSPRSPVPRRRTGGSSGGWRRSPRSTRARCSRSPRRRTALDRIHDELGEFADALAENRELQVFFFSPYFSSQEKKDGIAKLVTDARRELRALPRAAGRAPPRAGGVPDPARLRRDVGRGEQAAARYA